jgi:hypothetical protein
MESKTDDALNTTFLTVRNEIYNRFTTNHQNEQQAASESLKRSMTERERESEVIEIDTDITAPGGSKKTNRTVTDLLIKKTTHEDFVAAWSEAVLGKSLTFDFFSDSLVPPEVYGRHILCLRCLRVALFSEKKRGFFIFFPIFSPKKWTPTIKK